MARHFGENVRRHRERKDMSQADLAARMAGFGWKWHQSTVNKVEHGERRTDAYEVHDLAEILGVPIGRLFWEGAEVNATGRIDRAAVTLRQAFGEAADAIARLHAARAMAEHAIAAERDSRYPRVREQVPFLEDDLNEATPGAALAEGEKRWKNPPEGNS